MYDAIVIGARCAGATTAMLLARSGHRVLLVDRAKFPSEIPHGHFIHFHGPGRLSRLGLLERVLDTGCPPVKTMTMDMGDGPLTGRDLVVDGVPAGLGPRRAQLDKVLVDAAVEAGAELRDGFAVQELLGDGDGVEGIRGRDAKSGSTASERARLVIGADGRNSALARTVGAEELESAPALSCWYFSYWSGVDAEGLELYVRNERALFAHPTNDGLFTLFGVWPLAELNTVRADIEGELMKLLDLVPELAERVRAGRREERFYGATQLPNFVRRPHGPGWALVGDAGCHKDPYMALGVCDALRDAELLADAAHEGLSGERPLDEALADYERRRNEATLPWYELNLRFARLQPLPPEEYAMRAALRFSQEDTNLYYKAREGMVPPETFFNPENMQPIMSGAPTRPLS
ncbi:MAG: NAD(P)/FAD-dependent oxidoreductase [Thermoleophilaceae bacterium]